MLTQESSFSVWIRKTRVLFIAIGAFLGAVLGIPLLTGENFLGFLPIFPGAVFGGFCVRWLSYSRSAGTTEGSVGFPWKILTALGCAAVAALGIATLSKGHAIIMVMTIIGLSILAGFYAAGIDKESPTA
jgi:hypothetical protein